MSKIRYVILLALLGVLGSLGPVLDRAPAQSADELPGQAEAILDKHCGACHSKKAKRLRGDLDVFDRKHLDDPERKILVSGKPSQSSLITRLTAEGNERMPPKEALSAGDIKILTAWVEAGGKSAPATRAKAKSDDVTLASRVKEVFRVRCLECHGKSRPADGIVILDRDSLVKRRKVTPGKPDGSRLVKVVAARDDSVMPPSGNPPLTAEEIDLVRSWITAGAPAFPPDVAPPAEKEKEKVFERLAGFDHVHKKILAHVRATRRLDRPFIRYFSINHFVTAGATEAELALQRDALVKAVNHLSWEKRPVRLESIDAPDNTLFAIDLRKLGWHLQPFSVWERGRAARKSPVNLFDLALLEYPYAIFYECDTFDHLLEEYVIPSGMVRPIPYVRADWFSSIATQSPLYEDFLGLPRTLDELEKRLGVEVETNLKSNSAKRAGMTVSGVSRNNRVVERHPLRDGAYWKSFDFRTSKGQENMFKDPIHLNPTGGEFIFNLPNGLQGYYIADAKGERIDAAPTDIVTDRFAADKTVRNGLACIRCHDEGMKGFVDTVRPALERLPGSPGFDRRAALDLYVKKADMDEVLKEDTDRFLTAMKLVLGKDQKEEPLIPVSRRFLDAPLSLSTVAGELGLTDPSSLVSRFGGRSFTALGLMPLAARGVVRRDAWEEYYDSVVRSLGEGIPLVALDGLTRPDYPAAKPAFEVEMKTNGKGNVFAPGDVMRLTVTNRSTKPIWIELVGTSTRGKKKLLTEVIRVEARETYAFEPVKIKAALGKEQITLYASTQAFTAGLILRGKDVGDRVLHPIYQVESKDRRYRLTNDAEGMVKKTIEIETK